MKTPTHSDRFAGKLAIVAVLSVSAALLASTSHAGALRTVALTGQPAPGTPNGVNYSSSGNHYYLATLSVFRGPVLNDAGQTAFRANLTGGGVDFTNDQGVWSEGYGNLALVARTGSPAPGGGNFGRVPGVELFSPVLNNAGQTAFYGGLSNGNLGLWSEGSGSLALVGRDGTPAPGTPSGVNFNFTGMDEGDKDWPKLNDAGQTAFTGLLTGDGVIPFVNDRGIWLDASGSLALVARAGDAAPGMPSGVNFGGFFVPMSALNDAGQMAFYARLAGTGVDDTNFSSRWKGAAGSLELVARRGSPAPDTESGVNFFMWFGHAGLNNAGHTAIVGVLTGSGIDDTNNEGIWSDVSGSLQLVARRGNPAPGMPSGINFDTFFPTWAVLNDAGQLVFLSDLTGSGVDSTNNHAVWLEDSGTLTPVARTGSHAPGTPSGVSFNGFGNFPALNVAGQTAFRASLTGSGVDSTNDRGIWATDRNGDLQLLARTGDMLEVAPSDFRTLSGLDFVPGSGNSDGRPSGFNNLGQLVFWASFTDGSQGVFVSNAVAHLPGDFNNDGTVDAADYVAWRKGLGTTYDENDYGVWRANFGASLGPGSGSAGYPLGASAEPLSAAAPEPATVVLLALAAGICLKRRRTIAFVS